MKKSRAEPLKGRMAVLVALKRAGPVTADALAGLLGLTAMAVRQHLYGLEADGLARHALRGGGRGRPAKFWNATEAANARFPDGHAALTTDLLVQMHRAFGQEGLDRLVALRTADQEKVYASRVKAKSTLRGQLEALAKQRSEEGYMAEVRREAGTQAWLFVENHCPICAAARLCSGLCREELSLFQRVLGDAVRVERVSHILAGAGRCAYRVNVA